MPAPIGRARNGMVRDWPTCSSASRIGLSDGSSRDAILERPIALSPRGTVDVPQEPGIGIRIDKWKLRRYGRKFYDLTKPKLIVSTLRRKGLKTALELARIKKTLQP